MHPQLHKSSTELAIEKEKSIADAVLERLEIIDPTCILAGGAPRDWWLGSTANDLDFYLTYRGTTHDYEKALTGLGLQNVQPLNRQGYNVRDRQNDLYGALKGLLSVHEATYRGKSIQIMRMTQPTFRGVVDAFAVSLSKVWYKNGAIRAEAEAEYSKRTKIIRVMPGYSLEQRYVRKMLERFGDTYSFQFSMVAQVPSWYDSNPFG